MIGLQIKLEFKPRDLWIGVYWEREERLFIWNLYNVWICLIPTLPIHVSWGKRIRRSDDDDVD